MILVFQINQTFFLVTVGGSSDGEQWLVVKQAHQTLKRTPEIDFTLDNTENLMYECGKQTSVTGSTGNPHILPL